MLIKTLARSLTVSVFPVPAGPAGDPPKCKCMAPVRVRKHRSVRGVITNRGEQPKYSYPYTNVAFDCRTLQLFDCSSHS